MMKRKMQLALKVFVIARFILSLAFKIFHMRWAKTKGCKVSFGKQNRSQVVKNNNVDCCYVAFFHGFSNLLSGY